MAYGVFHSNPYKPSFEELEERNLRIRKLYYEQNLTQTQLAQRFDLPVSKIAQILRG